MGSRLRAAALVAGILALPLVVALAPMESGDAWWHIAIGGRILETGSFVTEEPFSHTAAGEEFTPQEWLSQLVLAVTERFFGLGGIRILTALLVLCGGLLIWARARIGGLDRPRAALTVAVVVPALCLLVEPRPHMFSFVFLGAFACIALRGNAPSWRTVALGGFLAALWANFHAVAVLAPLLAGAAFAESLLRSRSPDENPGRRLALFLATAAGVALNPSGLELYTYAFSNAGLAAMVIDEWQPFWFGDSRVPAAGVPIWAGVVVALALGAYAFRRQAARRESAGLLQTAGLAYLLLSARRWLWLGWVPAYLGLKELPRAPAHGMPIALAAAVLAVLPVLNPRVQKVLRPENWSRGHAAPATTPGSSADFLAELDRAGKLYHPYHWGGFLLYRLQPDWKVFVYGETAVFMKAGVIPERQRVEMGSEAEAAAILRDRAVDALVLPRYDRNGKPGRIPGGDGPDGMWIRAFANPREGVWLRRSRPDLVAAAEQYYGQLGIAWSPEWGYLEHHALLGNGDWCRAMDLISEPALSSALALAGRLRVQPDDDATRNHFLRGLRSSRFRRSAEAFEAGR